MNEATQELDKRAVPRPPEQHFKLDDRSIETRTAHYPREVQEPVLWAAAYCREKCNGQLSLLSGKCKALKFENDYTYWHKVFTGKYFIHITTGERIGSVKNFLQVIEALRKEERISWRAGSLPFIVTPTYELIRDFLDKKRQPGRVNKFGGIAGPTGSQKSASFLQYCLENQNGRCVHVEAPERPRMAQFITDLACKYGGSRTASGDAKIALITASVNETKTIIVDNVQRLHKPSMGGDQPVFNFLQKLQDNTGCTIIMSFTPDFEGILRGGREKGYFEQFIGRMGGFRSVLHLPEFATHDDLLALAAGFQLKDAEKNLALLERLSQQEGRIRIFFEIMQDARQLAIAEKKPFTVDHIKEIFEED